MSIDPTQVAIIGAGPSGLVAAKECLEAGLTPVVFEKNADLGGVWNPTTGKVWHSMKTNLSRYHMGFSDFAWPETIGDYPTNQDVYRYLKSYAVHFGVEETIAYNQSVNDIVFDEKSKNWQIETHNGPHAFKQMIMAGGVFGGSYTPDFPNAHIFSGTTLHAGDYKDPQLYTNNRPIVIGGSFSAYEIAADLAAHDIPVAHVFRRPAMIMTRYAQDSHQQTLPTDLTSYLYRVQDGRIVTEKERLQKRYDYFVNNFGNPGDTHPELSVDLSKDGFPVVISDHYRQHVASGLITPMHSDIHSFNKNGCMLLDQRQVDADMAIFCTGYDATLPSQQDHFLRTLRYNPHDRFQPTISAKGIFHPDLPGFAMTGFYRGPYFGAMELQARKAAAVFSDIQEMPSRNQLTQDVREEIYIRAQTERPPFPRSDYVGFMMDLGTGLDVLPHDLMEQAKTETTRMIPADFRRFGIGAKPAIAEEQRNLMKTRVYTP